LNSTQRPNGLRVGFVAIALVFLAGVARVAAVEPLRLNDGQPHGDPPFLLEPGWRPLLNGRDLTGWGCADPAVSNKWYMAKAVYWDPIWSPRFLQGIGGPGDRLLNGEGKTCDLVTDEKFGDLELYLEFMIAKDTNSGVYLHGLYEVQIRDTRELDGLKDTYSGGIYGRIVDRKRLPGSPPIENAARFPGDWQSLHIWFRAPRFDAQGRKTENARFVRVLYNNRLVQHNFSVEGPTQSHLNIPEAPENPIMLQGTKQPIAFRNIYVRPLREFVQAPGKRQPDN